MVRASHVQVESILISVISMISTPNADSPANVAAAVKERTAIPYPHPAPEARGVPPVIVPRLPSQKEFREDYPAFKKRVQRCVRKSQEG